MVLAALLLADRNIVSIGHLVESVWCDGTPPLTAPKQIRNIVSELRACLGTSSILPLADGYQLDLRDSVLDSDQFTLRLARARELQTERRAATAVSEYRRALALWRGPIMLGRHIPTAQPAITRLTELRLVAVEECVDLELALGRHHDLVGELAAWTAENPSRERLSAQFMLATFRAGRQADAIREYDRIRRVLGTEFGVAPSRELRSLHQRVIDNDNTLNPVAVVTLLPAERCDLPAPVDRPVGRDGALRRISELRQANNSGTRPATVSVIDGMAGVGKTTLAVHAAHLLSTRYPDAQLFLDLQAHSAGQKAVAPTHALDTLLRAIGVPDERIPPDLPGRSAEWRAQLARRRVIVVLDDAGTADQLRPLLPGTASSAVLITTRYRLVGLEDVDSLTLDVLSSQDARQLFTLAVDDDRPAADPVATTELLRLCGHLPLAVRIAAARLRNHPTWTVKHLVRRLRNQSRRLEELQAGDRSVSHAFALSYRCLDSERQRLLRLLGSVPCMDVDAFAVAALTGTTPCGVDRVLEDLMDANLLQEIAPCRYRLHELVHAYASTRAHHDERTPAVTRLVDYYLSTTAAATHILAPDNHPGSPSSTDVLVPLSSPAQAAAWLKVEWNNLLRIVDLASSPATIDQVLPLSGLLWHYLNYGPNRTIGPQTIPKPKDLSNERLCP